ncbi:ATP-binding protein [Vibrio alfacsensis]|uniref:AAA family ATPase n=1 Tax=Vibrio alfacsensis TaxID=1074311 RepID=UPI0040678486
MYKSTYEELLADLSMARKIPLLIDIQRNMIEQLHSNDNEFSLNTACRHQFDLDSTDTPLGNDELTNIIYIDAKQDSKSQLLQSIHSMIGDQLRTKLRFDALLKLASLASSDTFGNIVSEPISDLFSYSKDFIKENVWESELLESTFQKIRDLSTDAISEKMGDATEIKGRELSINKGFGNKLFITTEAEEKLLEIASSLNSQETPHQIMEYTFELLSALSLGAPKLIVINNPQYLDHASISILSIIFSYAKDQKQQHDILGIDSERAFNGISVLFQYTESDIDKTSEVYQCVQRLKNMAQRYGMLEMLGSKIPYSAIRSTMFIGRSAELEQLSSGHNSFCKYINDEYKDDVVGLKPSQWTLILGDAGVGKTALVNQHLKLIEAKKNKNNSHIRLRLLNQVGHSSGVTGLASLQNSINRELKRLINDYQLNNSFIAKAVKSKVLSSQKDFDILRNKAISWSKKMETASEYVASTLGYSGIYKAARSGYKSVIFDEEVSRAHETLDKQKEPNRKELEFGYLDEGLEILYLTSKTLYKNSLPILLFVDDLQWIDELSSEYIVTRFMNNHSSEIIFTARDCDSISSVRDRDNYHSNLPFTTSIFIKLKLLSDNSECYNFPVNTISNVRCQKKIYITGFDVNDLSCLIKRSFLNANLETSELIAHYIISALSSDPDDNEVKVNTVFAIETLNLISNKSFYQGEIESLKPIFSEFKNSVYYINTVDKKEITSSLLAIFNYLRKVYSLSYSNTNEKLRGSQVFTLVSYAVMEERIALVHKYFLEHGDIVVFALQISVLLGSPFDGDSVKYLITELSKDKKDKLLKPVRNHLANLTEEVINSEHFDILDDVFDILKRFDEVNKYKYRHSLYEIFLLQQAEMNLNRIFNSDIDSIHGFLRYCIQLIDDKYSLVPETRDNSPVDDPQLHISMFGFALQPDLWCLEVSDRLGNYGTAATGQGLASSTSYLKMIHIIPLQERLLSYLESKELTQEEIELYLSNLFDLAGRYFAMNGDDNFLRGGNSYKRRSKHSSRLVQDKYIGILGIETLEKLIPFLEQPNLVQDYYDSFTESLLILVEHYINNAEYEKSIPLQLKLIEYNSDFSFDNNYAYIFINNNLELYRTYLKLNKCDELSSIRDCILDTLEHLMSYCGDDGVISSNSICIDSDSQPEIYPITNVGVLKYTIFYVSRIFITTTNGKTQEESIVKVLDFYNKFCFEYPNFFVEDYIEVMKVVKSLANLPDVFTFDINKKTTEWYSLINEGAPYQWYETVHDYTENHVLRESYFCDFSIELANQYHLYEQVELFNVCVDLIDIGFKYDFFESTSGLNTLFELLEIISNSSLPKNMNTYSKFIDLLEMNFDTIVTILKCETFAGNESAKLIYLLEEIYSNYVLPCVVDGLEKEVELYHSTDNYFVDYQGSYLHDYYCVLLNQFSLVLLLAGKSKQSSEVFRLSLSRLYGQVRSCSPVDVTNEIVALSQRLIRSPLVLADLEVVDEEYIEDFPEELKSIHHLIRFIFESVLEQDLNAHYLGEFLTCKCIVESILPILLDPLDMSHSKDLYTLIKECKIVQEEFSALFEEFEKHCSRKGLQIQQNLLF